MLTVCYLYNLVFNTFSSHRSLIVRGNITGFLIQTRKPAQGSYLVCRATQLAVRSDIQTQIVFIGWLLSSHDLMPDTTHYWLFDIGGVFPLFLGDGGSTSEYLASLGSLFLKGLWHNKGYFHGCFILFSRRLLHVLDTYKAVCSLTKKRVNQRLHFW